MGHALDGIRLKIERAKHHLAELDAVAREVLAPSSEPKTAGFDYNTETQQVIVFLPKPTESEPMIPLMVGDCVHNARSALDHLVFQLAILNGASSEAATKTAFPVCLSPERFLEQTARKVAPYISPAALTEIEKLQPYRTGDGNSDILWVLSQLDIIDKHRLLIIAIQKFKPVSFVITLPSGEKFINEDIGPGHWKASEDGAEIIRFDLSEAITEPGKVNVKVRTANTIQIAQTGMVCDTLALNVVLGDCILYVEMVIDKFEKLFFT